MKKITYSIIAVTLFVAGFAAGVKYCDEEMQELEARLFKLPDDLPTYTPSKYYANYDRYVEDATVVDTMPCNQRQYPRRGERNRGLDTTFTIAHKNGRVARPRPGTEHGV